ncbi:hypothetical protein EKJ_21310 [Qipengyuania flava]|uniref:Caspase family protein n=2 Tax=Qipengyuania flava TaxID=192812 RepID=A0A3T1CJV9_9SPHN|nr:hypothetical protein EKJ_21310 [Qipengyuania flava]
MLRRAMIAMGCNHYEHLEDLGSAEYDAEAIFDALIQPQIGDYDGLKSKLLKSPTLDEVRAAFKEILFGTETLDVLTITFAGHGAVSSGSFYMALRDTDASALSATGLSLSDLFRMIAEAAPKQTYLVIDACQAGGLVSDLNVILKAELMGRDGTPGVSLLATAASDQAAVEVGKHGIGTEALLKCINGDIFLQDSSPALDLVEIGRAVSTNLMEQGAQTPTVWGLNLYGPPSFCKNPHVEAGAEPLRKILADWPDPESRKSIQSFLPKLWGPYSSTGEDFDSRRFVELLFSLSDELSSEPQMLENLNRRISESFAVQAQQSKDVFKPIEVRAAAIIALLPSAKNADIADHIAERCNQLADEIEHAVEYVADAITNYEYALVTGGLGDLYHLPIRISKLLGWAGFAAHSRILTGTDSSAAEESLRSILDRILQVYSLSLVAMSDCQSPYLITAITALEQFRMRDEAEQLLGFYFNSVVDCGGKVARPDLQANKVLSYLIARGSGELNGKTDLVAQPSELVLALLRLAHLTNLGDQFDLSLSELDHLPLNAYLPDSYENFGALQIPEGLNAVFQIGTDFWQIAELEMSWPNPPIPENVAEALASILAALVFPDRSPWFLFASSDQRGVGEPN